MFLPLIERQEPLPAFFATYSDFVDELVRNYGITNPRDDAVRKLEALTMPDNGSVALFKQNFEIHSKKTGYNDTALGDEWWKKMPYRIKESFSHRVAPRPTGYLQLAPLCVVIDTNQEDIKLSLARDRNNARKAASTSSSSSSSSNNATTRAVVSESTTTVTKSVKATPSSSKPNKFKKTTYVASTTTPASSDKPKTDLSKVLDKSGGLTQSERERRIKEKLCLYCGKPGHVAKDCRKAQHARGRLASIDEIADPEPAATATIEEVSSSESEHDEEGKD
jgi:hypothetical protein